MQPLHRVNDPSVKRLPVLMAFLVSITATPVAFGEPLFTRDWPIRLKHRGSVGEKDSTRGQLCVLDGDLMLISTFENGQAPGAPGDPRLPDLSLSFLRDGQRLRAKIEPVNVPQDRSASKALLAKDGWYVTADFSTDPPHVILSEKPANGSRWAIVDADHPGRYLIKNEDATGKAVFLAMEPTGKTYRGGIARKPILSAEQSRFAFEDAHSGK